MFNCSTFNFAFKQTLNSNKFSIAKNILFIIINIVYFFIPFATVVTFNSHISELLKTVYNFLIIDSFNIFCFQLINDSRR